MKWELELHLEGVIGQTEAPENQVKEALLKSSNVQLEVSQDAIVGSQSIQIGCVHH